jgi:hypothetical protein
MKYPPKNFDPLAPNINNGDPAHSEHAQFIDAYTTWLVAGRRQMTPVMMHKKLFDSGSDEYHLMVPVPSYTTHVGFDFLITGAGTVTVTSAEDAHNAQMTVEGYYDAAHSYINAQVYSFCEPKTVGADNVNRALKVTKSSTPKTVLFKILLDNASGESIKCHQFWFYPIPYNHFEGEL